MFTYEHLIYVSNYFIKKLQQAEHFYIDRTFMHPKGYKQYIVILYYRKKANKRNPGLFALIINK